MIKEILLIGPRSAYERASTFLLSLLPGRFLDPSFFPVKCFLLMGHFFLATKSGLNDGYCHKIQLPIV